MADAGGFGIDGPHTDPKARPTSHRNVVNARVVRVQDASYRKATFSGVFQVAKQQVADMPDGDNRILCKARWYGWSGSEGLHIEVRKGGWTFESGYTGPVVAELGSVGSDWF